jgi:signal transduction histidine kinase
MNRGVLRSLQFRLTLRLFLVYVIGTGILVGILVYQAYDTSELLSERQLGLRADDLARAIVVDQAGSAQLALPPVLATAYQTAGYQEIFGLRGSDGRVIAASPPEFGIEIARWPLETGERYFRLSQFGPHAGQYFGLNMMVNSKAGPLAITVAHAGEAHVMVHSLLRGFVKHIAWVIAILLVITLLIGIVAIRNGLRPLRQLSRMATEITPATISHRLPEIGLPIEVAPLVSAMNRALDRLEHGFAVQREFTANAAHELRTPLSIISLALEEVKGDPKLGKLSDDATRMNRLVDQLLRVARLDSVPLNVSERVDLNEVAAATASALAPWIIEQERRLGLTMADGPVLVPGNAHAIEDAVRNLIENAVRHSPRHAEVAVSVQLDGRISVLDHGVGVEPENRKHIFERFWRGQHQGTGAGLGLAIVRSKMEAHSGSVEVDDSPGGGATFTLQFPAFDPGRF